MSCCGPKPKPGELKFNANYNNKPLALKFWSKHDDNSSKTTNALKTAYYEKEIEKRHKYDARFHSKLPRYANQTYGWLPGYKLHFLQNCDVQVYKNADIQKLARSYFSPISSKIDKQ